jgi:aryl-alcohol dehydrogenase-like predicted oxidoreductase
MKYTTLGRTDIRVSRVSFGCWELGGGPWEFTSDQNNIRAIRTALDNGVTTFDTAEGYGDGHSEEIVGKALAGRRGECVIATKVSPSHLRASEVRASLQGSLKRLATDYVDLYYIHWPNAEVPIEETMTVLNQLKQQGLIRAIGVSNFSLDQLKAAAHIGRIDAIQPEYSLLQRDIETGILEYCRSASISVLSYSSIAKGILSGAFHLGGPGLGKDDFRARRRLFLDGQFELEADLIRALKEIADSRKATLAQVAIAWILHQKGLTSAIVGTQNEKHLLENVGAADVELSSGEIERLSATSTVVLNALQRTGAAPVRR